MSRDGWYYLHTNGDLIYKSDSDGQAADIKDSPFALMLWPIDLSDRENAWRILVEASSLGASKERISELAEKWGCNNEDAKIYADYVGVILSMDGDKFCATRKDFINLIESPHGFGDSYLEAMAELCTELGFKASKMWGLTFKDLLAKYEVAVLNDAKQA